MTSDPRATELSLSDEFRAVADLEVVYGAAALVRQVFVYADSERSRLLAVVVPVPEALAEYGNSRALKVALKRSLQDAAAGAALRSNELPIDILIETEPFTHENGLLSPVGRLVRSRLKDRYGHRLEQMYVEMGAA
ncbi:MAG: fatty acid CoA ligase FadD9 [Mycobacterium sp.]|jgi:fatty acid CoA ligase FadD9|nr:fatty acid CoA ligase FadD9 [Mycobacterium sp.]